MNWPVPQDFNEAVQTPTLAFNDPDLKAGQPVVGPTGLPLPRSGNFADVYQIRNGKRDWAVKCFTRPVTGLDKRYQKVAEALAKAKLPFTIKFTFLNEGVRVRGQWLPSVKMEWVDGLQLNQVVRENAGKPAVLEALLAMWSKLCRRLRDSGIAHADLQHGNVLLVPGSKSGSYGLKLIDYDGMYVPALGNQPSGELGHPNYQHPGRASNRAYSPDLDRFPHLVVATALKGLAVLGQPLWDRYDTGDNLLFVEEDFRNPAGSKLMHELWKAGDPGLAGLVGRLALACSKPIPQTPWLDQVAPEGVPALLEAAPWHDAAAALGLAAVPVSAPTPAPVPVPVAAAMPVPVPAAVPAAVPVAVAAPAENAFAALNLDPEPTPRPKAGTKPHARLREVRDVPDEPAKKSLVLPLVLAGVGLLVLLGGGVVAAVLMLGGKKPDETVQTDPPDDPNPKPPDNKPKPPDPGPKPPDPGPKPPDPGTPKPPNPPPVFSGPIPPLNLDPAAAPALPLRWEVRVGENVMTARPTADGKWIVVKDFRSRTPHVYSTQSGAATPGYSEGAAPLAGFAPLADGNVASWGAGEPFAIVWNPATGKPVGKIPVGTPPAGRGRRVFEASPDGRYVVVGTEHVVGADPAPGQVKVYDAQANRDVLTLTVHEAKYQFTPDGRLVVADQNAIRWFRLADGASDGEVPLPGDAGGRVLACSPDGYRVLYVPRSRPPQLLDARTAKVLADLPARFFSMAAAFSPDGRLVALCSLTNPPGGERATHVEVIDLSAGRLVGRFPLGLGAQNDVVSLAFTPDGKAVVLGRTSGPGKVQVVDLPAAAVAGGPKPPDPLPGQPVELKPRLAADIDAVFTGPRVVTFDAEDRAIVLSSLGAPRLIAYNLRTGAAFPDPATPPRFPVFHLMPLDRGRAAWFHPTTRDSLTTWEFATGKMGSIPLADPPESNNNITPIVGASPDGRFTMLARFGPRKDNPGRIAYDPGPLHVMDVGTGKPVVAIEWTAPGAVVFAPDSSRVLVAETTGRFRWFKLPSGQPDGEWTFGRPEPGILPRVHGVSADGRVVLYEGTPPDAEYGYHVIDGRAGKPQRSLSKQARHVSQSASLSDDGRFAALTLGAQGADGTTCEVIDTATGAVVARATVADERARFFLSNSGRTLVAIGGAQPKLTIFELPFGGAVAAGGPVPKAARLAVPDAAAVAKAEANVRTIFKDEYARRQPAEKKALAQKLLETAEQTRDDPVTRYALLSEARDLAAEGNDPALMVQAVEAMAKWYDVDGTAQKLAALEKVVTNSGNPLVLRSAADLALSAADAAADDDEYDTATKFAQVASNAARRGNLGATAIEDAEFRITQAKKAGEAFAALKPALEKLKAMPDDPEANLAVGRYRCFVQGRWDDGLKHLAKGSLPALKVAAALDLEAPKAGFADVKVADAWWDYAQNAPAEEKRPAEARARYWYGRAVGGLNGLAKARADQRTGFTHNAIEYRPGLIGEYAAPRDSSVLKEKARIDPVIDFNSREFAGGRDTEVNVRWTGAIQAMRPGRYRLIANTSDPVRVKVDGRTVIDTISGKTKKDASITLTDRPSTLVVEYMGGTRNHALKLSWVPAGSRDEELIPAECLFHDRKSESILNK